MHDSTRQAGPAVERYAQEGRADLLATLLELSVDSPASSDSSFGGEAAAMSKPPQPSIDGYDLLEEVSRGGQAVVFEGTQKSTGRRVAIKILRDGGLATAPELARFDREVTILAALDHPNIVSVIDRGTTTAGSVFLVMPYIAGRPLDQFLQMRQGLADGISAEGNSEGDASRRKSPDPADVLHLFLKICDAVNAAHLRGIVHRDLKPSNIRVDEDGDPHVLDFGLARPAFSPQSAEGGAELTVTGQFIGSLPWASPEQADGVAERIDTRSDVYSLGVILYQMLTGGRFPYEVVGTMRDVLNNILTKQPMPPSAVIAGREAGDVRRAARDRKIGKSRQRNINPIVESIVLKALSKRREDRYQTAGELARDISNYLAGRPTLAAGAAKQARRWGWPAVAAGVILGAGIASAVTLNWPAIERWRNPPVVQPQAQQASAVPPGNASPQPPIAPVRAWTAGESPLQPAALPPLESFPPATCLEPTAAVELDEPTDRLCFSPNAQRLLLCTKKNGFVKARLWDPQAGKLSEEVDPAADPVFTADGRILVASGYATIRYNPQTLAEEGRYAVGPTGPCAASPAGHFLVFASLGAADREQERAVGMIDAATGRELGHWPTPEPIVRIAMSPDGRTVIYTSHRGGFGMDADPSPGGGKNLWEAIESYANSAQPVFSRDGSRVALVGPIQTLAVLGARDGRPIAMLQHLAVPTSAAFLPDGRMLLTGDANRSAGVHLWDLQSGREIPRFEKTDLPGPAVVLLTPDGKRVVAGCADGSIHLLDVANGTDVVPPRAAHAGSLTAICISADGKTVASAGADKRVRQWRLTEPATTRPTTQPASASPGIGASD